MYVYLSLQVPHVSKLAEQVTQYDKIHGSKKSNDNLHHKINIDVCRELVFL